MKKVLFLLLVFMATVAVNAQQVSRQQALQKAQQFMPGKQFGQAKSFARGDSPTDMEPFYIFNAKGQKGFVIVSGDDRTEPILGYSDKGEITEKNMPENLKYWLECYEMQMKHLDQTQVAGSRGSSADRAAIAPLIQTKWDQGAPYNFMCPDGSYVDFDEEGYNANNRCATGCVATAMAQVMYYHKWPKSEIGPFDQIDIGTRNNKGTEEEPDWQLDVDHSFHGLPATKFDWDNMTLTYSLDVTGSSADAVAKLMRYCGQVVHMNYGLSRNGGSSASVSASHMVANFGYSKNAKDVSRMFYTVAEWEDLIYRELANSRPVLYGGNSASGGHQFVCDGYDGKGLFHFNWGWSGSSDGYFVLSLANPQDLGSGGGTNKDGYSYMQNAIIGLEPDKGQAETPDIYSLVSDKDDWVTEYNRSSATEDFTGVNLPRTIFMQYNYTEDSDWPVFNLDYAWGLYQDGQLVGVYGTASATLTAEENSIEDVAIVDFGAGRTDGTYILRQIYRPQGSEEWTLCNMVDSYGYYLAISYIKATISGNTLVLSKANEDSYFSQDIEINSVSYSPSSLEAGKAVEVTVNLTNRGDAFQELISFWCGNQKTMVCGSVEPGQTGTVKLHFIPKNIGQLHVQITVDEDGSIVGWEDVLTIEAPKPQILSATAAISGFDEDNYNFVLTGTTFNLTASITNEGENIYDDQIELRMFERISNFYDGTLFKTISQPTTIPVGETKEVEFTISGLNPDKEYFYYLYYKSSGSYVYFSIPTSGILFSLTANNLGDADGNGVVDANDVKTVVDYIMGKNPANFVFANANLNGDNVVDAADLVLLISMPKSK